MNLFSCRNACDIRVMRLLREMGLTIATPMLLRCDNQGVVDLLNNWSSSGRTRHIDCRQKFLRELKEANLLRVIWVSGESNESDINTKNVSGPALKRHTDKFMSG